MKTLLRFGFLCAAAFGLLGASNTPAAGWFNRGRCAAFDRAGIHGANARVDTEHLRVTAPTAGYAYDPVHHIAFHIVDRGGAGTIIVRFAAAPRMKVTRSDLSSIATTSGIKLGSSAATVTKLAGKPLIVRGCGLQRYVYTVDKEAGGNMLAFTIANGRVIEIDDSFGD